MKLQKVYAIVVALEEGRFDYYLTEPQIFYYSEAEAETVVEQVIQNKKFKQSQIKILPLWKIKEPNS